MCNYKIIKNLYFFKLFYNYYLFYSSITRTIELSEKKFYFLNIQPTEYFKLV